MIRTGQGALSVGVQGGRAVEHMGVDPDCPQLRLLAWGAAGSGHGPTFGHQVTGQGQGTEAQSKTEQVGHACTALVDKEAECPL